jgi:sporulation protein YlmC with PRC-barrel domain
MRADIFEVGLALVAVASFSSAVVIFVGSLATAQGTHKPGKPSSAAEQQAGLHDLGRLRGIDLVSSAGKELGELEDVIVDSADGSVDYAVLSTGGVLGIGETRRLVPWVSLKLESKIGGAPGELLARTHLSQAQIDGAPEHGEGRAVDAALERRARGAADVAGAAEARERGSLLLPATALDGAPVIGEAGRQLGRVRRITVDPKQGFVGYLVFAADGELGLGERRFALPWPILEVAVADDATVVVRAASLNGERLANAPQFVEGGPEPMYRREWVAEVSEFYRVDPYWASTRPASAPLARER